MNTALLVLGGLALLVAGGEALVRGASQLALRLGLPPVVIALTVVAFGSSAPELVASLAAGFRDQPGIIVGNVLGSNLANIALVIGLAALVRPIEIHPRLMRGELPFLILLQAALFYLLPDADGASRLEGLILAVIGVAYLYLIFLLARRSRALAAPGETVDLGLTLDVPARGGRMWTALTLTALGLLLLPVGAHYFLEGAIAIAEYFGLSGRVIGLTIVSVGTSMPEIVTTLIAVARKNFGIAAGTALGSNVFNICYVLGISALVFPFELPAGEGDQVWFDLCSTMALTVLLFLFCFGRLVQRFKGLILILGYLAAIGWSVRQGML